MELEQAFGWIDGTLPVHVMPQGERLAQFGVFVAETLHGRETVEAELEWLSLDNPPGDIHRT